MIGWAVLALYVAGFLWTVRTIARRVADDCARGRLARRNAVIARSGPQARWSAQVAAYYAPEFTGPLVTRAERTQALSLGLCIATVWPLYWPFISAGLLFGRVAERVATSSTELAEAERVELELLREQARELRLSYPEDDQ